MRPSCTCTRALGIGVPRSADRIVTCSICRSAANKAPGKAPASTSHWIRDTNDDIDDMVSLEVVDTPIISEISDNPLLVSGPPTDCRGHLFWLVGLELRDGEHSIQLTHSFEGHQGPLPYLVNDTRWPSPTRVNSPL